jgi:hypothetical protein
MSLSELLCSVRPSRGNSRVIRKSGDSPSMLTGANSGGAEHLDTALGEYLLRRVFVWVARIGEIDATQMSRLLRSMHGWGRGLYADSRHVATIAC